MLEMKISTIKNTLNGAPILYILKEHVFKATHFMIIKLVIFWLQKQSRADFSFENILASIIFLHKTSFNQIQLILVKCASQILKNIVIETCINTLDKIHLYLFTLHELADKLADFNTDFG